MTSLDQTPTATRVSSPVTTDATDATAQGIRGLARIAGALSIALAVFAMMGPLTLEALLVPGDAAATAANIASSPAYALSLGAWVVIVALDVALSVVLLVLLSPAGRSLSLLAAALRLVYSAALAALLTHLFSAHRLLTPESAPSATAQERALEGLETFSDGFLVALVFFGLHLVALGVLFYRSRAIPRVLGLLLIAAGVGYVVDSSASLTVNGYGGIAAALLLTPAVLGEVGLALWLVVKGVDADRLSGGASAQRPLNRSASS